MLEWAIPIVATALVIYGFGKQSKSEIRAAAVVLWLGLFGLEMALMYYYASQGTGDAAILWGIGALFTFFAPLVYLLFWVFEKVIRWRI